MKINRLSNARTPNSLATQLNAWKALAKRQPALDYGNMISGYLLNLLMSGDAKSIDVTPSFFKVKSSEIVNAFKNFKLAMNKIKTKGLKLDEFSDMKVMVDLMTQYVLGILNPKVQDLLGLNIVSYGEDWGGPQEGVGEIDGHYYDESLGPSIPSKITRVKYFKQGIEVDGGDGLTMPFDGYVLYNTVDSEDGPEEILTAVTSEGAIELTKGKAVLATDLDYYSSYHHIIKVVLR